MQRLLASFALLLLLAPAASFGSPAEGAVPLPPDLFGLQQETLTSQDPDRPSFVWSGAPEMTQEQWLATLAFEPKAATWVCTISCFPCGQCPPGDRLCRPYCP